MTQTCKILKKFSFSAVPDSLFSCNISPASFKVAAWALGRPDGWVFHVGHMLNALSLTEKQWLRVRKELIETGFFIQKKSRDERNKIVWSNIFVDAPLYPENSIPPKSMDGISIHAKGMDAEGQDIAADLSRELKAAAADLSFSNIPKTKPSSALQEENPVRLVALKNGISILNAEDFLRFEALLEKVGEATVVQAVVAVLGRKTKRRLLVSNVEQEALMIFRPSILSTLEERIKDQNKIETSMKIAEVDKALAELPCEKLEELRVKFAAEVRLNADINSDFKGLLPFLEKKSYESVFVQKSFRAWFQKLIVLGM